MPPELRDSPVGEGHGPLGFYVRGEDSRDVRLAVGFLRRWGFATASEATAFPPRGVVVLLSRREHGREEAGRSWASGAPDRILVVEPPEGGPPLADWPAIRLTQKRTVPARIPDSFEGIDDAYLTDLVEIAWTGFETRLRFGRRIGGTDLGYLFVATRLLADKAAEPGAVIERAVRFKPLLDQLSEAERAFPRAAYAWMKRRIAWSVTELVRLVLGAASLSRGAGVPRPLRRLPFRAPSLPDDPQQRLLHWARLVAALDDRASWSRMLEHLDLARGLFRRSLDAPLGQWQLHAVMMCAVARRLSRHAREEAEPVWFPEPPVGTGPGGDGRWLHVDGPNVLRLGGSLLTNLARRMDPPSITYPHDYGEWMDLSTTERALVEELEGALPAGLRCPTEWPGQRTFCLCVRHDVDRPLTRDQLNRHLDIEDSLGCTSSWYFKRETFDPVLAGELVAGGREVGCHAERISTGDDGFLVELTRWLGGPPGVTYHGGLGSEFWRGRRSLESAARFGARYAEMPVGRHHLPGLWPWDQRDLPVTPLPVRFDTLRERAEEHSRWLIAQGGMLILEQHPDLWSDAYREFLTWLCAQAPACLTVAAAIDSRLPVRPAVAAGQDPAGDG